MKRVALACVLIAMSLAQPNCTEVCRIHSGFEICERICKIQADDTQDFLDEFQIQTEGLQEDLAQIPQDLATQQIIIEKEEDVEITQETDIITPEIQEQVTQDTVVESNEAPEEVAEEVALPDPSQEFEEIEETNTVEPLTEEEVEPVTDQEEVSIVDQEEEDLVEQEEVPIVESEEEGLEIEEEEEEQEIEEEKSEQEVESAEASIVVAPGKQGLKVENLRAHSTLMTLISVTMIVSGLAVGIWGVLKQCQEQSEKKKKHLAETENSTYERLTEGDLRVIEAQ